jgi:hypothetical protein
MQGLGAALALGGVTAPAWAMHKGHPHKLAVYRLQAHYGVCDHKHHGKGCSACRACKHHAKNKRFATPRAANHHRAHKGCNCKVVFATWISYASYLRLFGKPGNLRRRVIDLRDAGDRDVFVNGREAAERNGPHAAARG